MSVGFVILNFNTSSLTKSLAISVSNYECVSKVIVVDNCSTDDSYEILQEIKSDKILIYKTNYNGGYSYGNNYGAKICKQYGLDTVIIANPDVEIEYNDLKIILDQFDSGEYSLLTGVEYDINKQISNPAIWNLSSYMDDVLDCFVLGRRFKKKSVSIDYNKNVQTLDMFKGSFFAVKTSDFFEVNGFDEGVFLFCEERILSKKLLNAGKTVGLVTAAKYYHNHSYSINNKYKKKAQQIRILYKSRLYYQRVYNNQSWFRMVLLKICMFLSVVEYMLKDCILTFHK